MNKKLLTQLSEQERAQALQRYQSIQSFLEGQSILKDVALAANVPYGTAKRWVSRYRREGLAGLANKRRQDKNRRRIEMELQQIIAGLALQKTRPTAAAIYRQVKEIAESLYLEREMTISEICVELSISKPTLYSYLRYQGVKIGDLPFG